MSELSGLRFDIYERVHLDEEGIGIGELEEVELSPYIEVYSSGEQAILRGNLLLTGKYIGEGEDRSSVALEYSIPVEISIPMSRIQSLEDIQVEIENFDIDLLTARSLNVTGLLTLHGIQMISEPATNPWSEEEEISVVHQVVESSPWQRDINANELSSEEQDPRDEELEISYAVEASEEDASEELIIYAEREEVQDVYELNGFTPSNEETQSGYEDPQSAYEEELRASEYTEEVEQPWNPANFIRDGNGWSAPQEDKKELRVAFGAFRDGAEPSVSNTNGLQTLIHSASTREVEYVEDAVEVFEEQRVGASTGDELEWKNLFLNGTTEEPSFRRLRMCIVQREETITTIAERYNMNPREILLHNRMSAESQISEGQVIFIPR